MAAPAQTLDVTDGAVATVLAVGAALCWALSVDRMRGMDMGPGSDLGSFSWFLPTWVLMMGAMMVPSALPAIVSFEHVRRVRLPVAHGFVFAVGYLAVWTVFGAVAFLLYRGLRNVDPGLLAWESGGRYLVVATAVAAGLYELTPIKRACLARCRTVGERDGSPLPISAVGYGADCVGCSIGLMALLLVIGAMSITWMAVIGAILFVQKVLPAGLRATLPTGIALIAFGAWIAIDAGSAPGLTIPM